MGNIAANCITIGGINIKDYMNISNNFYAGNNHMNYDNNVGFNRKSFSIGQGLNNIPYNPAKSYSLNHGNAIHNIYRTGVNEKKDQQIGNVNKNNYHRKINNRLGDRYHFCRKNISEKDLSPVQNIQGIQLHSQKYYFDKTLSNFDNKMNSPLIYDMNSPSTKSKPYIKKPDPIFDDLKMDILSPFRIGDSYVNSIKSINNDGNEIYIEAENNIASVENLPQIYPAINNKSIESRSPNFKRLNYLKKINLNNLQKDSEFNTEIDERDENTFLNRPYINEPDYNLKEVIQQSIDDIRKTMNYKAQEFQMRQLKASGTGSSWRLSSPPISGIKEIKLMNLSESQEKLSPKLAPFNLPSNYKSMKNIIEKFHTTSHFSRTKDNEKMSNSFESSNVKNVENDILKVHRSHDLPKEFKYSIQNKYIGKKPLYLAGPESPTPLINAPENNSVFNAKIASIPSSSLLSIHGQRQGPVIDNKKLSPKSIVNSVGQNSSNVHNISQIFANGLEKPNVPLDHIRQINKLNSIKSEKDLIIHKHNQLSPNKVPNITVAHKLFVQPPSAATIRYRAYSSVPFFQ